MSGHAMTGPRSLADMALKVAVDNIRLIKDLSSLPPHHLRTILNAVKTPAQLHEIELSSDDIYDETARHWQRLITKDFRALSVQHKYAPNNRKSWHKVYNQYKKLQQEQIAAATAKMMQDFAEVDEQRHSRSSKIISCEKSKNLRPGKVKAGFGPPRERASFFQQTKQQVRLEASRFNLRTPTGQLAVPAGQIKKAPQSKLEEVRIANQPTMLQALSIRPARTKIAVDRDREMKEARLRRLKNPRTAATGNVLVFTDDEESGADNLPDDPEPDDDDLFGDLEPRKRVTSVSSTTLPKPMPLPATERPAKRQRDTEEEATEQPAKRHQSTEEAATEQAVKRRRDTEEEATEQPAKRHRSTEEAATEQAVKRRRTMQTTATSVTPNDKAPPHSPPSANSKPHATTLRPTLLSAAPGTNGVLRMRKPGPPPANNKPNPTTIRPTVLSAAPGTNGVLRMRKPAPPKAQAKSGNPSTKPPTAFTSRR